MELKNRPLNQHAKMGSLGAESMIFNLNRSTMREIRALIWRNFNFEGQNKIKILRNGGTI